MSTTNYNRIIRKLVVGFGELFNNINLVRYNPDNSEQERFLVPISYASKEKYVQRLEGDPNLDKKVQITLPRMSFEMNGLSYDASRKQNTNIKNFSNSAGGVVSQYSPVPYNFDFSLYIYVRNIEDGTQIIEHILPYFTPDYTIKVNLVPEMGIIKEVPIVLNSTSYDNQYEGSRDSDTRLIIWTLNFTVKGFIFGNISDVNIIKHSITSIYSEVTEEEQIQFVIDNISGVGKYKQGEIVYQGFSISNATATGNVVDFVPSFVIDGKTYLTITNVVGNFVSNLPITGLQSNASYKYTSYNITPVKYAQIDITPFPSDADANTHFNFVTTITEGPYTANVMIPVITSHVIDLMTGYKYIDLL